MSVEHPSPAQLRQSMAFLSSLPSPTEISVSRDRHPVLGDRTEEKTTTIYSLKTLLIKPFGFKMLKKYF